MKKARNENKRSTGMTILITEYSLGRFFCHLKKELNEMIIETNAKVPPNNDMAISPFTE